MGQGKGMRGRPCWTSRVFRSVRSFVDLEREADMLVANVRSRFTREDAHFALALLAQSGGQASGEPEERLRDEGIDAILDDPRLLRALLATRLGSCASEPLFLYVVARHALLQSRSEEHTA